MKFIHLSDLHLGKTIYGVSLIDSRDQEIWIRRFLERAAELQPDAVVIAGDIYDRSSPSGEAVKLFDQLLTGLSDLEIPVLIVAGNHDSAERLSFAKDLLTRSRIYLAGQPGKKLTSVTLPSGDGTDALTFWLMPYLFPALVSRILEDDTIRDYDTAVRRLLAEQDIDFSQKNILIAHQNVTAFGKEAERGGSESMVGGVGQIDYTAFDGFTYAALGHIHSSYPVGRPEVRYAGTPLCYHFDELRQPVKGPLLVEVAEDGSVSVHTEEIPPLHPMRRLEDSYDRIKEDLENHPVQGEYLRIVIHDRKITPEISSYLRELCRMRGSVLMELLSDFSEFSSPAKGVSLKEQEEKSAEELFVKFYKERRNDAEPDDLELEILKEAGNILRSEDTGSGVPDEKAGEKLLAFVLKQEEKQS